MKNTHKKRDAGLQTISIRLQKTLIENLKKLAKENGIGFYALATMRP